jgi:hypothetical protein
VQGSNFTVPYKSDEEATYADLTNHHVILIGIPQTNAALWRGNVVSRPILETPANGDLGGALGGFGGPIGGFGGSGSNSLLGSTTKTNGKSPKIKSYQWESYLFPVTYGTMRSFKVEGQTFANSGSAVIAAGANPFNSRYSIVVIAGLSAEATYNAIPSLLSRGGSTEVLLLPARAGSQNIVVNPYVYTKELIAATKAIRAATIGKGN